MNSGINPHSSDKGRKPAINANCIGCWLCVALASDVFEISAAGVSQVIAAEQYNETMIDESIRSCPVNAIAWEMPKKA